MKRWHVFTDGGRKIAWAPDAKAAREKAEHIGLKVRRVVSAPDPLKDAAAIGMPVPKFMFKE
jgi:hypothetical protein